MNADFEIDQALPPSMRTAVINATAPSSNLNYSIIINPNSVIEMTVSGVNGQESYLFDPNFGVIGFQYIDQSGQHNFTDLFSSSNGQLSLGKMKGYLQDVLSADLEMPQDKLPLQNAINQINSKLSASNITASRSLTLPATLSQQGKPAVNSDGAMKGGIDLTKNATPMSVRNKGGMVTFTIDPAEVSRLDAAGGLIPLVSTIYPLQNLTEFLGMKRG